VKRINKNSNKSINKNTLITLLFLVIFSGSTWLAYYTLNLSIPAGSNQPNHPDSYMKNVDFTRYNDQGMQESNFHTPSLVHYPKQNSALLVNPRLVSHGGESQNENAQNKKIQDKNRLVWVITAKQGISEDDGKVVYLKGNVQIQRTDTAGKTATLTTSALTAYPKKKHIETDQPVTIVQPGSIIHAVGFTADLNTGDIHLLSQTQTTYEPSAGK